MRIWILFFLTVFQPVFQAQASVCKDLLKMATLTQIQQRLEKSASAVFIAIDPTMVPSKSFHLQVFANALRATYDAFLAERVVHAIEKVWSQTESIKVVQRLVELYESTNVTADSQKAYVIRAKQLLRNELNMSDEARDFDEQLFPSSKAYADESDPQVVEAALKAVAMKGSYLPGYRHSAADYRARAHEILMKTMISDQRVAAYLSQQMEESDGNSRYRYELALLRHGVFLSDYPGTISAMTPTKVSKGLENYFFLPDFVTPGPELKRPEFASVLALFRQNLESPTTIDAERVISAFLPGVGPMSLEGILKNPKIPTAEKERLRKDREKQVQDLEFNRFHYLAFIRLAKPRNVELLKVLREFSKQTKGAMYLAVRQTLAVIDPEVN